MARKRDVLSASVAVETLNKLQAITEDVQRFIGVPIHHGMVVDQLVRSATSKDVLALILGERTADDAQGDQPHA